MQNKVVVLGTGGTIAGSATSAQDGVGYVAGALSVAELLQALPGLDAAGIEAESLCRIDSKDMSHAVWRALAQRVAAHLERPEVAGMVVTHGTDTLEETAYFLHRVLGPAKPVVLTAAMRPASALSADGPQNLFDAITIARMGGVNGARGVVAVLAGTVHGAAALRKQNSYRVDAFDSGDAGPLARLEEGRLRSFRPWPDEPGIGLASIEPDAAGWPAVDVVASHAGVRAAAVDGLVAAGAQGLVVAGTGNGTIHVALEAALRRAEAAGVTVWRSTRCAYGAVVGAPDGAFSAAGSLGPWQARIELMLLLLEKRSRGG
ncbi:MAG: asparaginase [Burkholderiales bacterium]|nr:asparaginase [Burkholderiales bacterium]